MSGSLNQGLPQRMTAFIDPKTGLITEAWWRFLASIWQRTGAANGTSSLQTVSAEVDAMTGLVLGVDVPTDLDPAQIALLAALFDEPANVPENEPALYALMVSDA